jgi:hypothetical protein
VGFIGYLDLLDADKRCQARLEVSPSDEFEDMQATSLELTGLGNEFDRNPDISSWGGFAEAVLDDESPLLVGRLRNFDGRHNRAPFLSEDLFFSRTKRKATSV